MTAPPSLVLPFALSAIAAPTFLSLTSKDELCAFLGIPKKRLNFLLYVLTDSDRYQVFEIPKRNKKGFRKIRAPLPPLKELQQRLALEFQSIYRPTSNIFSYVRGSKRGIRDNADPHVNSQWLLKLDLEDYFPSINFGRVIGLLKKPPFSFNDEIATIIAQICICDNELPQGAPTSPILSNFVSKGLDRAIQRLCVSSGCAYTRYADDLSISTVNNKFPRRLVSKRSTTTEIDELVISAELERAISEQGFKINHAKSKLINSDQRQMVTGVVVNERPNVSREYLRNVRAMLYAWKKHGIKKAGDDFQAKFDDKFRPIGKAQPDFRKVVRGKVLHIAYVRGFGDPVFQRYASQLSALDPTYVVKASEEIRLGRQKQATIRLLTEGVTDKFLIRAALKNFKSQGAFRELQLQFDTEESGKSNDDQLLKTCDTLCKAEQKILTVCLFDRDIEAVIKKVTNGPQSYKHWGYNVLSAALPYPSHLAAGTLFCIEMLFEASVLKQENAEGQRLFLRNEFDSNTGCHNVDENLVCLSPSKNTLIVDDGVTDIKKKKNVALPKKKFSESIVGGKAPFENVSFEGFRPLFVMLLEISMKHKASVFV